MSTGGKVSECMRRKNFPDFPFAGQGFVVVLFHMLFRHNPISAATLFIASRVIPTNSSSEVPSSASHCLI